MSESVLEALHTLRDLGTPREMRRLADRGYGPRRRPKSNSHIHLPPNFSAFESVEEALSLAAEQGIGILGVSNYYDFEVYGEFTARARAAGIFPLFGLEIICLVDDLVREGVRVNDPGNPGKFYFCGKGITRFAEMTRRAKAILGKIRANDAERTAEMIRSMGRFLTEHGLPIGLTESDVIDRVVRRHRSPKETVTLQERHVAQAYQEAVFDCVLPDGRADALGRILNGLSESAAKGPVRVQNEIRSQLMKAGKPAFVAETFITFGEAYDLVLELGGIPCYPTLADGADPICEYETPVEKLIYETKKRNIHAAEYIPIRNKPEVLASYVKAMRSAGLVVTAGTEHNTIDLLPIEPTCAKGAPIPEEILEIFWEGACVAAAHQFLSLSGECGFVDEAGNPNSDYETAEERIQAFRGIGAAVIQRYYEAHADTAKVKERREER